MKTHPHWKPLLLALLVLTGITLAILEPAELQTSLNQFRIYRDVPGFVVGLILAQIFLYMFAMPGSWVLWVAAPLYAPLPATAILVSGTTLGGIAGYYISGYLGEPLQQRLRRNRTFQILERRSDFLTITALRMTPGFPHSVINYSAGLLRLPIAQFTIATVLGLIPKTYLYCYSIDKAVSQHEANSSGEWLLLITLVAVSALILLVRIRQIIRQHKSDSTGDN